MSMQKPMLYVFSGLPGSGKTTLAKKLCSDLNAVYLRIDTVEQALKDLFSLPVEGEGYRLSYRIAVDNLQLGNDVIVDSCNPIQLTRDEWHEVALKGRACFVDLEILCSDKLEHRQRVETREVDIIGLKSLVWEEIQARKYDEWTSERIQIDTASQTIEQSFETLKKRLMVGGFA